MQTAWRSVEDEGAVLGNKSLEGSANLFGEQSRSLPSAQSPVPKLELELQTNTSTSIARQKRETASLWSVQSWISTYQVTKWAAVMTGCGRFRDKVQLWSRRKSSQLPHILTNQSAYVQKPFPCHS